MKGLTSVIHWKPTDFLENLQNAPEIITNQRRIMLTRAMTLITTNVVQAITEGNEQGRKAIDRGLLRQSISPGNVNTATGIIDEHRAAVGSRLFYADYLDKGTRPHWPPRQPIQEWVWRHKAAFDITKESEAKGIAFVIARKISKVGTKGYQFLAGGLKKSSEQLTVMAKETAEAIVEEFFK